MITCLSLTIAPYQVKASENTSMSESSTKMQEAHKLVNRLEEIRSMDLKNMDRSEKKELRKEVLSINEKFQHPDTVIYISGGALILILILLIILL
jgi:hypothetical protein